MKCAYSIQGVMGMLREVHKMTASGLGILDSEVSVVLARELHNGPICEDAARQTSHLSQCLRLEPWRPICHTTCST